MWWIWVTFGPKCCEAIAIISDWRHLCWFIVISTLILELSIEKLCVIIQTLHIIQKENQVFRPNESFRRAIPSKKIVAVSWPKT